MKSFLGGYFHLVFEKQLPSLTVDVLLVINGEDSIPPLQRP